MIELIGIGAAFLQLFGNIRIAYDWTGDQLRKHTEIGTEAYDAFLDGRLPAPEIDRIGHRLERIEADADRQTQSQRLYEAYIQPVQVDGEEIPVLEETEQEQVKNDAQHESPFSLCRGGISVSGNIQTEEPVDSDRGDHDQDIDRFTPAVEEKADQKQHQIAETQRYGKIGQQHKRQISKQECQ